MELPRLTSSSYLPTENERLSCVTLTLLNFPPFLSVGRLLAAANVSAKAYCTCWTRVGVMANESAGNALETKAHG
jgi:hypothetical protein